MSEEWQDRIIGDFSQLTAGGTPDTTKASYWADGVIPWLSSGEVHKKRIYFSERFISYEGLQKSAAKIVPPKTVLVALAGQGKTRGTAAITEIEATTNQSLAGIITDSKLCEPDFLFFNLQSRYDELRSLSGGSGRAGLNLEIISNLDVRLPPLPEQQKIAAILTSVDEVIEKTEAQISKLENLKKGMMQELLTKGIGHTEFKDSPVGRIPKSWRVERVADICTNIIDCVNKTAPLSDSRTRFRMIRTSNVRKGRIDLSDARYVDQGTFEVWTRRGILKKGDIVFTREAPVGECGIIEQADGLFLGQRTILYRPNPLKIDSYYLLYAFQSEYCMKQLEDMTGGSTVGHIRVPDCGKIYFFVPPLLEQQKISASILPIDSKIYEKERKLDQQRFIKMALMQDLLTGRVRVKVDT